MIGIYKILNKITNDFYVGSAIDVEKRFRHHKNRLRTEKHHNIILQRAWNKYGEANFLFEIIEEVNDKNILLLREQYYLDNLYPLYNICKIAGNTLGRKHTKKTRKKISLNHHDVSGENNPMYGTIGDLSPNFGKKHKPETIEKMIKNHTDVSGELNPNSKLTIEKVREIREKYKTNKFSTKQLAMEYQVGYTTIRMVISNKTWKE